MKIVCSQLYFILTNNKCTLHCSSHACYRQQITLDCVTKVMQCTSHTPVWLARCVSRAAAVKLDA